MQKSGTTDGALPRHLGQGRRTRRDDADPLSLTRSASRSRMVARAAGPRTDDLGRSPLVVQPQGEDPLEGGVGIVGVGVSMAICHEPAARVGLEDHLEDDAIG